MLICDKLIYVELQKTGSRHIKALLKEVVGGGLHAGKHSAVPQEMLASGKKFIASIRDPWSWYLSLWSSGCLQKGELYDRLTNEKKWHKTIERAVVKASSAQAAGDANKVEPDAENLGGKAKILPENFSAERAKNFWYADPDSPQAFREWLRAVLAVPLLRQVLERGYGKSPISRCGGLLTYRYFSLYTKNSDTIDQSISTVDALHGYDKENCFIDYFVRNESLPFELIKAIEGCGVTLDSEKRQLIRQVKRNEISSRPYGVDHYYDEESVQLIARRERFIIEKFGYKGAKPLRQDVAKSIDVGRKTNKHA